MSYILIHGDLDYPRGPGTEVAIGEVIARFDDVPTPEDFYAATSTYHARRIRARLGVLEPPDGDGQLRWTYEALGRVDGMFVEREQADSLWGLWRRVRRGRRHWRTGHRGLIP